MQLNEKIKGLAARYFEQIVAFRRHIHAHPELSFEEKQTAAFISAKLSEAGIAHTNGIAGTGITALIQGRNPGKKTTALRADMDALPIVEENDVPYKSKKEGVMHACGHDVHSSSLLGTAMILQQLKDEFEGTVKLIFQPGEEKAPGGAKLMIEEGILQEPNKVNNIIGQHVMPLIPVGKVGFKPGIYMASADELYLTVKGKGGHAAQPHSLVDPILITSHIIITLQQVVSRKANPITPSVLSFGKIIANGATNVIPNEVYVEGTFRTLDEHWREEALEIMKKMAEHIAAAMGGEVDFNIVRGYPYLKNDEALTLRARNFATEYLGSENVVDLSVWMAAEDFAFYSQQIDACFYRLGTRNEARGIVSGVHTPTFDIDEKALEIGAGLMAWIAINELAAG